jgi:hypothetical protein
MNNGVSKAKRAPGLVPVIYINFLAPQVGLEPTTLRLTEGEVVCYRVLPNTTK